MAKYIALANWTEKGMSNIKEAPERVDAVRALAKSMDCEMKDFFMTTGAYDMVVMMEAPDDETMAKLVLTIGRAGNVRTTTLKAFDEKEFREIVGVL